MKKALLNALLALTEQEITQRLAWKHVASRVGRHAWKSVGPYPPRMLQLVPQILDPYGPLVHFSEFKDANTRGRGSKNSRYLYIMLPVS